MSSEPKLKIDPAKVVAENAREVCGQFGLRYLHELAAYTEALENVAKAAQTILQWHSKFDGGYCRVAVSDLERLSETVKAMREIRDR